MPVLCLAGAWCGDCINQCPAFDHFARASPAIDLRFLDRDARPDVRDALAINGGHRVPVVVFLSEDGYEVSRYGERTLSTYRTLATEQLGPACPTGLVPPPDDATAPSPPSGSPSSSAPSSSSGSLPREAAPGTATELRGRFSPRQGYGSWHSGETPAPLLSGGSCIRKVPRRVARPCGIGTIKADLTFSARFVNSGASTRAPRSSKATQQERTDS